MLLRSHRKTLRPADRRGAILIVVISLLTIFAVIGITFVFYSASEADAARIHKDSIGAPDNGQPDPSETINQFLGSLIYPVGDALTTDLTNALRGHDLARGVYGWTGSANQATNPNLVPFNGVGTFHEPTTLPTTPDRARVVNYTVMSIGGVTYLLDPEWTGMRPLAASPANTLTAAPVIGGGRSYIAKNAPYTYPDANNLFLASISPQTGQVLLPSFYRPWQFRHSSQAATASGLEPPTIAGGNPNWTSPEGRAFILRPRPTDNTYNGTTEFPYVPANADGSFTGDVQNLPGGYYHDGAHFQGRNDSLWMYTGLQPRRWNGKWVVPLVAPLILDLDGRVNLSVHGNTRNAGNHASHAGYGPWEVNLARVFDPTLSNATLVGEANNLVSVRLNGGIPTNRAGHAGAAYYTTTGIPRNSLRIPAYSQVNWDGTNSSLMQTPAASGNNYTINPTYTGSPAGYEDNATTATKQANHPSLFNPAEWPAVPGNLRTFQPSDLRRLSGRFGAELKFYQQTDLYQTSSPPNNALIGTTPSGATARLDPALRNRLAVTTLGATLDVPGMLPGATATPYAQAAGVRFGVNSPGSYAIGMEQFVLPPIDLNRPLADYRDLTAAPNVPTPAPLSSGNMANLAAAQNDRHLLARDIFARLCLATGGTFSAVPGGYSNGTVTIYTTVSGVYRPGDVSITAAGTQMDAIRNLAQLAVNIVDYIDNDDISTIFAFMAPNPANPLDPVTLPALYASGGVVIGVEKPRLVLNEAYSEITNDPDEMTTDMSPPSQPAHVRFWVELLNPTRPPYLGGTDGAIGTGGVALNAYRLQILRDNAAAAGTVHSNMQSPANVLGTPTSPTALPIEAEFSFTGGGMPTVMPNNNQYGSTTPLVPATGVALVGPTITMGVGPQPFEFNPAGGGAPPPWNNMIATPAPVWPPPKGPQNSLAYLLGTVPDEDGPSGMAALNNDYFKRHVIVLQRLVNPHLPFNPATNPYITVDYMDWVSSFDAVNRTPANTMMARTPKMGGMLPGYDPAPARYSIGKVQPYAGYAHATLAATSPRYPSYSFTGSPRSFVLQQNPNGYDTSSVNIPRHTFGRHNGHSTAANGPEASALQSATPGIPPYSPAVYGGETLMSPFDMFPHLDRPLANPLELLHVAAVRPHKFTQDFVRDFPAGTIRKDLAYAPWLGTDTTGNIPGYDVGNGRTNNQLYRAFDLLRVRPWGSGSIMGGKVHGRININTVQDPRVLHALFDPQAGNGFDISFVDTVAWNQWLNSRTALATVNVIDPAGGGGFSSVSVPVPSVNGTAEENPGLGADRPFKPFGVGELNTGTVTTASGLQDTVLRTNPATGLPLLWIPNSAIVTHPYQQAEALRKVMNNITTTSNTFVVIFTVSYFEVRTDPSGNWVSTAEANGHNRPILGKEAFRETPGDLRQQFVAVVDRNNITVNPTDLNSGPRPFFTSLEAVVQPGASNIIIAASDSGGTPVVYADGVPIALQANMPLVIGSGFDQEVVLVDGVSPFTQLAPGYYRVNLAAATPTQRYHPLGTVVSNARLGNPGQQTGFDVTSPNNAAYRHVVPYWARTR